LNDISSASFSKSSPRLITTTVDKALQFDAPPPSAAERTSTIKEDETGDGETLIIEEDDGPAAPKPRIFNKVSNLVENYFGINFTGTKATSTDVNNTNDIDKKEAKAALKCLQAKIQNEVAVEVKDFKRRDMQRECKKYKLKANGTNEEMKKKLMRTKFSERLQAELKRLEEEMKKTELDSDPEDSLTDVFDEIRNYRDNFVDL